MAEVMSMIDNYRLTLADDRRSVFDRFDLVDVARKVVGVGSVGTHCWIALLEGPNHRPATRWSQVKEAQASVLEPYVGESPLEHHGLRVVSGQRLTRRRVTCSSAGARGRGPGASTTYDSSGTRRAKATRWRWTSTTSPTTGRCAPGRWPGPMLAPVTPVEIAGYLGTSDTFERAIAVFSARYAITNERDYRSLLAAMKSAA